jgi:hypothetical protein
MASLTELASEPVLIPVVVLLLLACTTTTVATITTVNAPIIIRRATTVMRVSLWRRTERRRQARLGLLLLLLLLRCPHDVSDGDPPRRAGRDEPRGPAREQPLLHPGGQRAGPHAVRAVLHRHRHRLPGAGAGAGAGHGDSHRRRLAPRHRHRHSWRLRSIRGGGLLLPRAQRRGRGGADDCGLSHGGIINIIRISGISNVVVHKPHPARRGIGGVDGGRRRPRPCPCTRPRGDEGVGGAPMVLDVVHHSGPGGQAPAPRPAPRGGAARQADLDRSPPCGGGTRGGGRPDLAGRRVASRGRGGGSSTVRWRCRCRRWCWCWCCRGSCAPGAALQVGNGRVEDTGDKRV